jgi:hypothetical protein
MAVYRWTGKTTANSACFQFDNVVGTTDNTARCLRLFNFVCNSFTGVCHRTETLANFSAPHSSASPVIPTTFNGVGLDGNYEAAKVAAFDTGAAGKPRTVGRILYN